MVLIPLKKFKPITPGLRWQRKLILNRGSLSITKKFTKRLVWHSGRNTNGRVAFNLFCKKKHKKRVYVQAVKLNFFDIAVSTTHNFYFARNKPKTHFITKNGGSFLLPATTTNLPGKVYYSTELLVPTYKKYFCGLPIQIKMFSFYSRVSNVAARPYYKYQYATASGSFCTKLRAQKREKNIKFILPSKQYKFFTPDTLAIFGTNLQYWLYKLCAGKAGVNKNKGLKEKVRGIAMNSVDHPHGGKANSVQPEVSPWGWITKKSH